MTTTENNARDDKCHIKKEENRGSGKQENNDKAPGKGGESGYPNDDYWEKGVREKSKEPPADSPEPDTGYRWETSKNRSPNPHSS